MSDETVAKLILVIIGVIILFREVILFFTPITEKDYHGGRRAVWTVTGFVIMLVGRFL